MPFLSIFIYILRNFRFINEFDRKKQLHMWCIVQFINVCKFKKHKKQPWRSVTFSLLNPSTFLFHGSFSRFFKLYKCYQIAQSISYNFWFLKYSDDFYTTIKIALLCNNIYSIQNAFFSFVKRQPSKYD